MDATEATERAHEATLKRACAPPTNLEAFKAEPHPHPDRNKRIAMLTASFKLLDGPPHTSENGSRLANLLAKIPGGGVDDGELGAQDAGFCGVTA